MKPTRWLTHSNPLLSHLRIATAGTLVSAAAAMAFVAANTSSPPLLGKSDRKGEAKREAKFVRSEAASRRFETLLGEAPAGDGAAQEEYDNRAYPNVSINAAQTEMAARVALQKDVLPQGKTKLWQEVGPSGVRASAVVAGESTGATAGTIYSGRATAIALAPDCNGSDCKIFIGAAGGGVWTADNALASRPNWHPSNKGIPSNAIGSIAFDPTDATGKTLYVGTGEPNGSSDSEAGVGLYKSTDAGQNWTLVSGSTASTAPCASGVGTCPVAKDRSIGAIAVDPANPNHIFIGTDVARHGSSSVNGGRFTPPEAAKVGLYESSDGGATFTLVFSKASDTTDPALANGGDFFRGGVSHIELYRAAGETQVYASLFDYGVYRRSMTQDGDTAFHRIFASAGGGSIVTSSISRTEFSLAPNGANLRIYVGDNGGAPADFYRVDNANVPHATLADGGTNSGWTRLSSPVSGTPGFASYNYCSGQCWYDMPVYSPPGAPDIVYIGGALQYGELDGPSNGRGIQRSNDAGVSFTDMTIDTHGVSLHPDQHAIVAPPSNPNAAIIANDGGLWRLNGLFSDVSSQCSSRGLSGADLKDCKNWLSKVPTTILTMNEGLGTLQFQSLSVNAQNPLNDIMGGTQDNGTQAFSPEDNDHDSDDWFVTIFGDGGQSGISPFNPSIRFHNFFLASPEVNFHGTDPKGWDVIYQPLFGAEPQSFYIPMIFDPTVDGTMFAGLDFVWRTTDNGGSQSDLDTHCNEFTGDFTITCGDWVRIGQGSSVHDATKALGDGSFWGSKGPAGAYVVAIERAPSDNRTLWVGTRRGRVFVTSNAHVASPGAVTFNRIDTAAQPERFVSGIAIDQSNPNHAFISYSGYNAYATAAGTATGHVFEVTYNPVTHVATWSPDLAGGDPSTGGLGDQPLTDIAVDWSTGDLYVSTDFGVDMRKSGNTTWQPASRNLSRVAVYGLTIDVNARVLYAATHGRGAWRLDLSD
jgi:hypothetical protein